MSTFTLYDILNFTDKYIDYFINFITEVNLFPYLHLFNYLLICNAIRFENEMQSILSRHNVLSNYCHSMAMCFAGDLISPLLLGEMPASKIEMHEIYLATVVWYVILYNNYYI